MSKAELIISLPNLASPSLCPFHGEGTLVDTTSQLKNVRMAPDSPHHWNFFLTVSSLCPESHFNVIFHWDFLYIPVAFVPSAAAFVGLLHFHPYHSLPISPSGFQDSPLLVYSPQLSGEFLLKHSYVTFSWMMSLRRIHYHFQMSSSNQATPRLAIWLLTTSPAMSHPFSQTVYYIVIQSYLQFVKLDGLFPAPHPSFPLLFSLSGLLFFSSSVFSSQPISNTSWKLNSNTVSQQLLPREYM